MSNNPFETINQELSEIKNILLEIKDKPIKDKLPENYSVQTVSKIIGCSDLTTYSLIKRGLIPASKIGRKYLIKRENLENALTEYKSLKYRRDV